jgi:DNA-binding protein HU-beta
MRFGKAAHWHLVCSLNPELDPVMAAAKKTTKTTKKEAPAAAKKAPAKKAAAKKAAVKKAAKAAKAAKVPGVTVEALARAAYLNYRRRVEQGLPGDSDGDWLEAERQLAQGD